MSSIITFQRDDSAALTKNFARAEFQCPCGCGQQTLDTELAEKLQLIRDKLETPITVTSGYRCFKRNAAVGGSASSRHRYGMAADWRTKNRSVNPVALGILAQAVGFGGIGIYWHRMGAFCHVDTRQAKTTWLCTATGSYQYTSYNAFVLPTVQQGSTGATNRSAIIMLQKLLKVKEDGNFGPGTDKALMIAQEKFGLTVDGICGPASWKALSGADKYLKKL